MFRFKQEPSSGSHSQWLAKITYLVQLCVQEQTLLVLWRHIMPHIIECISWTIKFVIIDARCNHEDWSHTVFTIIVRYKKWVLRRCTCNHVDCLNVTEFCMLSTRYICVFLTLLSWEQRAIISLTILPDATCFLWCKKRIIKYYLRYCQALKLKIYIFCNSAGNYFFLATVLFMHVC
jgi:hypothetical protein